MFFEIPCDVSNENLCDESEPYLHILCIKIQRNNPHISPNPDSLITIQQSDEQKYEGFTVDLPSRPEHTLQTIP